MQLKHTVRSYFVVDYHDLDNLLREYYPGWDTIISDQELHNDMEHAIWVQKEEISEYDIDDLEKSKAGKHVSWCLNTLMTDLCNRDIIEPGDYLITICW